jgi:hypothetical protein
MEYINTTEETLVYTKVNKKLKDENQTSNGIIRRRNGKLKMQKIKKEKLI